MSETIQVNAHERKHFEILGLMPRENLGLIKAAYREPVKQFHPDAVGNSGMTDERMKAINESYHHLMGKFNNKR